MKRFLFLLLLALPLFAEPRRYIVELRSAPTRASVESLQEDARMTVRREFRRLFRGVAIELQEGESIEAIAQRPDVVSIYPDLEVRAFETSSLQTVQQATRIRTNATGRNVVVAVIDTGIDATHPALAGKVIGGYDFFNNDPDPADDHQHGTHVAGIIAATSSEVMGVAPGVSLLAYKVLDREGHGVMSNVIAALERAMDPNQDGDTSDRADIANLSLGSVGHPNDPVSRAVDRAVAAGMVVCAAAGNEGANHRIGSPAGATGAITVGASSIREGTLGMAYFSSRGPSTGNGAIKPDLVGPGVMVLSTVPGGQFRPLSGTSMATPYVAGLAALLLELHPDWTPARIKSALVATALPLPNEEVMTQGSGEVNPERALANDLVVTPTHLSFGLDGLTAPRWTATQRLTVRNENAGVRTIRPRIEGTSTAISLRFEPAELTIGPNESREFAVTIDVDNSALGRPVTDSLSFGGRVTLEWEGNAVRVPWAFVRAGRATLTVHDGEKPSVYWGSDVPRYSSGYPVGHGSVELLLEPGLYDFVVVPESKTEVRVFVGEQQRVEGDVSLHWKMDDAKHEVRLEGADERGVPFTMRSDGTLHSTISRVLLPLGGSVVLPAVAGRTFRATPFSERFAILANEIFIDGAARRMYVAQHPLQRGLSSDVALRVAPGDYASQQVRLHLPRTNFSALVSIFPRDWPRNQQEFGPAPPRMLIRNLQGEWTGTLFMTPEVHPDYAGGVQLGASSVPHEFAGGTYVTPVLRRRASGFFSARGFDPAELPVGTVSGEVMEFGHGPTIAGASFEATATALIGEMELLGDRNESRRAEKTTMKYLLLRADGSKVAGDSVPHGPMNLQLPGPGTYRLEAATVDARAKLVMEFDTRAGSATPPSFTTLAVLDDVGRHSTRLPYAGNASVVFSAARATSAGAAFRRKDAQTWVQLSAVEIGNDPINGRIYRLDLRDALRVRGELDLALEVTDGKGNRATWNLGSALNVEDGSAPARRRSVRK
jgi:hypothetical protein